METLTKEEPEVEGQDNVKVDEQSDVDSTPEDAVSSDEKSPAGEPAPQEDIPLTERPEFKKAVQSAKDKELKTLQSAIADLNKKLKAQAEQMALEKEDAELKRLEAAELGEWGEDRPEVKNFQQERRNLHNAKRDMAKQLIDMEAKLAEHNEVVAEAEKKATRNMAFELALRHVLPEGDAMTKAVNEFVEALMEAETPKEMQLLAKVKASELAAINDTKQKRKVDSGYSLAPGGIDANKLSPTQQIEEGLRRRKK